MPIYQRVATIQQLFKDCVESWENMTTSNWRDCDNIFLSSADFALVNKTIKDVGELIKAVEVKINNVVMMVMK